MTSNMVDWQLAVALGSRISGAGPEVSAEQAAATVTELRAGADRSTSYVREFTGLEAGAGTAPVLVVDRPAWIQANVDGFAKLLTPIIDKVSEKKGPPGPITQAVGSRITGANVGGLLGFLSSKVLGQFDPFHDPAGRLLLVAPNVVHVERELGVDPHDFRLWVCLHEETHRVQFTAVPWIRDHLFSEFSALADTVEPQRMLDDVLKRLSEAIRSGVSGGTDGAGGSLLDIMGSPEQKAILERVTGVMSLLEGHADVVMDGVGPGVIPSVDVIRAKFDQRSQGFGVLDRLIRKLLGLEAKMAQYRDGAAFVRAVVDKAGMAEFNTVWAEPANLPSKAEINDPSAWIARVL
jgi:coenzyme F420 biosynthesis associated uncharacterized protein